MKLNEKQVETIKQACEEIEYGSVTVKINKENKFVDIVVDKQIRLYSEPTKPKVITVDKKY